MADYPDSIYSPRAKENRLGIVYDATKKRVVFAEDISKLDDEVVAIETYLKDKLKMLTVPSEVFKVPTLKPAAHAEYGIASALEFADGNEEIAFAKIMLPTDIDKTVQPSIHLEWSTPTQSANCYWRVEYLFRAPNQDMTDAADATINDVYESSAVVSGLVHTVIQLANLAAGDSHILLRISRMGGELTDTLGASAFLSCICIEYQSDKIGA